MREVSYSFLRETLDPGEWDGDNNARGDDRRVNVTAEPIERHFNPAVRRFHLSPGEEMWDCCDSEDTSLLWGISIFTPFITPSCSQISILRDSHSQGGQQSHLSLQNSLVIVALHGIWILEELARRALTGKMKCYDDIHGETCTPLILISLEMNHINQLQKGKFK